MSSPRHRSSGTTQEYQPAVLLVSPSGWRPPHEGILSWWRTMLPGIPLQHALLDPHRTVIVADDVVAVVMLAPVAHKATMNMDSGQRKVPVLPGWRKTRALAALRQVMGR